jgi:peptide/nickel transport system substrate-binding protein
MPSRARRSFVRSLTAFALALGALLPALAPVRAADPLVLHVGTTQDLDAMNPFMTELSTGYEVFTLNYDLLVNFGNENQPIPGFAESWTVDPADPLTWTFKIHPGMKWSDGQPATSADVVFSYNYLLKAPKGVTGNGYLNTEIEGVVSATATDPLTVVVKTSSPRPRLVQAFAPIIPEHIWKDHPSGKTSEFSNKPTSGHPVVGTGPYQAVEWRTAEFARFVRNPEYQGPKGAADEVILHFFKSADAMVQALKSKQIDYAQNLNPDQWEALKGQPNVVAVAGAASNFYELGFNCYTKTVKGGGASTKALQDPAFRSALGWAIDTKALVEKVLKGHGEPGTTQVPPFMSQYHVDPAPDKLRHFDLAKADQLLTAAGYPLVGGKRMDKEGKALNLRLGFPNTDDQHAKVAAFIKDWFGQLGIGVSPQKYDSDTLTEKLLPPEGEGKADYDMFLWDWIGAVDPDGLISVLTTGQIGTSSDSNWSNAEYDRLYDLSKNELDVQKRKDEIRQMQEIFYDQAPYLITYYGQNLHAYRTEKFVGWQNQPANGVPLFGNGSFGYNVLQDAAKASPPPTASPPADATGGASVAPVDSGAPAATLPASNNTSSGSSAVPLVLGIVALIVILAIAGVALRSRRSAADEDE